MKNKKLLVFSSLAAAVAMATAAGATFALFTSDSKTDIAVTSGKVNLSATIDNLKMYSGEWNATTSSYDSKEVSEEFTNGGSAVLSENQLTLSKMSPMDKVTFTIDFDNQSNINIKYRTLITAGEDTGLFSGLKISFGGETFDGISAVSSWTDLAPLATIESVNVSIELPKEAGNEYQDKECAISFAVEAVQGNTYTEDAGADFAIYTASDLFGIAKKVNSNQTTFGGKTVKLMSDIDLAGKEWTPIGNVNGYPSNTFTGIFDGNGHKVSNMVTSDNTVNYATAGFFGSLCGTVQNLTIENPTITSTHYAGGIVGYSSNNASTIENCHVIGGSITSTPELIGSGYDNGDKVGGIIGYMVNGDKVNNCSVEGTTITAHRDLGGIVGTAGGDTPAAIITNNSVKDVTLIQSNNNGYKDNVTTIGEIVGRQLHEATLTNSTFENVTIIKNVTTVSNKLDLEYIANNSDSFSGKKVVMVCDIDLNNEAWSPIGYDYTHAFTGTFDGMNHTISNLKVNTSKGAGLFGFVVGKIQNLNIDGANIVANDYAAAVVGQIWGSVTGCSVKNATIIANPYAKVEGGTEYDGGAKAGAIVGYKADGGQEISNNTVENVTINAYRDLGGIVGYAQSDTTVSNNTVKGLTLNYITIPSGCTYDSGTTNSNMGRFVGRKDAGLISSNNTDLDA